MLNTPTACPTCCALVHASYRPAETMLCSEPAEKPRLQALPSTSHASKADAALRGTGSALAVLITQGQQKQQQAADAAGSVALPAKHAATNQAGNEKKSHAAVAPAAGGQQQEQQQQQQARHKNKHREGRPKQDKEHSSTEHNSTKGQGGKHEKHRHRSKHEPQHQQAQRSTNGDVDSAVGSGNSKAAGAVHDVASGQPVQDTKTGSHKRCAHTQSTPGNWVLCWCSWERTWHMTQLGRISSGQFQLCNATAGL